MKSEMTKYFKNGKKHGLINEISNYVKTNMAFQNMDALTKAKVEKEIEHKKKIVKARYLHRYEDNATLPIPYTHGAGYPIQFWEFYHDEVYELPLGLVEKVNHGEKLAKRGEILDPNTGMLVISDRKAERIHRFVAESF